MVFTCHNAYLLFYIFGAGILEIFMFDEGIFVLKAFKNLLYSSIAASETLKNTIKSNNYARATMCRNSTLHPP